MKFSGSLTFDRNSLRQLIVEEVYRHLSIVVKLDDVLFTTNSTTGIEATVNFSDKPIAITKEA